MTALAITGRLTEAFPQPIPLKPWDVWGELYMETALAAFSRDGHGDRYEAWKSRVLGRVDAGARAHGAAGGDRVAYLIEGLAANLRQSGDHEASVKRLEHLLDDWRTRLLPVFDGSLAFLVSEGVIRPCGPSEAQEFQLSGSALAAILGATLPGLTPSLPRASPAAGPTSSPGWVAALRDTVSKAAVESGMSEAFKAALPLCKPILTALLARFGLA